MKLLLISNSTNPGEPYLDYPKNNIKAFLGPKSVEALFIPFAAVTFTYDEYEKKVAERFHEIGHRIKSLHHFKDRKAAIEESEAIVVGGGNTWQLLKKIQESDLISAIRKKVRGGSPYIGWSAGSNVACPSIRTTNDMPIVEPDTFGAFNFIPFQINPHYTDVIPAGHAGETREERIREFIEINPGMYVAGLREGTMLQLENNELKLIGNRSMRIFKKGNLPFEVTQNDDISFLLK